MIELDRRRSQERWIAWIRGCAVAWAVLEVGVITHDYPPGRHELAWIATGLLAIGAAAFAWLAHRDLSARALDRVGFAALAFDTAIVYAYYAIYQFEEGVPTRGLIYLAVVEAAVRFAIRGGVVLPLVMLPALVAIEWTRADQFAPREFDPRHVTIPLGIELIIGLIVGGLVRQVREETSTAEARAAEAEDLRDQIGRRADQLELVNRAGRALSSSLELDEAFRHFCREIRSAVQFDRLALVLANRDRADIIANVGAAEDTLYPAGSSQPIAGSVVEDLLAGAPSVVVGDMRDDPQYPEDRALADVGLRSRAVAPLSVGGRVLGMISISRRRPHAFARDDVDLLILLGRQLATAIENIRAFEAERTAAEELRRLSALRADFVSLVSHELRGPMASIVGAAATLRQRWRELNPEQRQSFLALLEGETARLASLVGDVLDTSRLDAGTFTYSFSEVDLGDLVREVAALVDLGQEEVAVRAEVEPALPTVRADRERMRQVVLNLLTNAVKYTNAGDEIEVRAGANDGHVEISVRDHGPGISYEEQRLIFEKFGRASGGSPKPGAGLGLFIARSITEAHGGALSVDSQPGAGATFTVRIPASG
jgi:signal transduction histidine kinase